MDSELRTYECTYNMTNMQFSCRRSIQRWKLSLTMKSSSHFALSSLISLR